MFHGRFDGIFYFDLCMKTLQIMKRSSTGISGISRRFRSFEITDHYLYGGCMISFNLWKNPPFYVSFMLFACHPNPQGRILAHLLSAAYIGLSDSILEKTSSFRVQNIRQTLPKRLTQHRPHRHSTTAMTPSQNATR